MQPLKVLDSMLYSFEHGLILAVGHSIDVGELVLTGQSLEIALVKTPAELAMAIDTGYLPKCPLSRILRLCSFVAD